MRDSGDRYASPEYEKPTYHNWAPLARRYHPLQAGSIDGTDNAPHDNAVWRAMNAKFKPNKQVTGDPDCTLFVGHLSSDTTQDTLEKFFSKHGDLVKCRIIRDFVTGFSRGYAFVEYKDKWDAKAAYRELHQCTIDGHEILVENEVGRNLKGWIPRRFGGGFGGKKESGQLRFGGRDRPFRRPLPIRTMGAASGQFENTGGHQRDGDRDDNSRERNRVSFRDRGREQRDRDRDSRRNRERDSPRDRDRDSLRDRDRDSLRDRDRDSPRDHERDSLRDRDCERDSHRDKHRDREKDRDHKRDRDRHREKSSSRSRDHRDRRKDDSRKYKDEDRRSVSKEQDA